MKQKQTEYAIEFHPTEAMAPAPWFNRTDLNLTPEFLEDIRKNGVRQNLLVRPVNTSGKDEPRFEIIAGVRRWTAARQVGVMTIPVRIEELDDKAAREARLTENLQREGLSVLDEAQQYSDALAAGDYGDGRKAVDALAAAVGRSRSHIYSLLRLVALPELVKAAIAGGQIDPSVGALLASIPDGKRQAEALKDVMEGDHEWDEEKGEDVTVPMSFREAKAHIDAHYRKSLKDAPFDLEAEGLTGAHACLNCPLRTGNMEGLPSGSAPNVCTDPLCYRDKCAAYDAQLLAPLKANGETVLEGKEAAKLWQYGRLAYNAPYLPAGGERYVKGEYVPLRKLLGKRVPRTVYTVNPDHEVMELWPKAEVDAALLELGHVQPPAEKAKPETADDKAKRELEERLEREVNAAAAGSVLDPEWLTSHACAAKVLMFLLEIMDNVDLINHAVIMRRRGWDNNGGHFLDHARKLEHKELYALLVECFLVEDSYADDYDAESVDKLARLLGQKLDRKKLAAQLRAKLAPAPEPKERKAAKEAKPEKPKKTKAAKPAKVAKVAKAKKGSKAKK